jgi:hypothetical protein
MALTERVNSDAAIPPGWKCFLLLKLRYLKSPYTRVPGNNIVYFCLIIFNATAYNCNYDS